MNNLPQSLIVDNITVIILRVKSQTSFKLFAFEPVNPSGVSGLLDTVSDHWLVHTFINVQELDPTAGLTDLNPT